ncbi:MAG TPA: glucose-1-phosphate cytidylyltransferase [Candidatus Bathyarchaeia archaeon]|nr:glucose-1-phosphate cytidylyltransferase [Candidatus Bathyarchaeia archaeon]
MQVVILCGGKGTRLREETVFKPKSLVEIGGKPILWHIMKIYSYYGYNDFILSLGYKGFMIKDYFLNYDKFNYDFTLNLKKGEIEFHDNNTDNWNITFANTGDDTNTGGRIKRIEKYIEEDTFLATYGDGVADIDIQKLIDFHFSKNLVATLTGFHPTSKYGILDIDKQGTVTYFQEKPVMKDIVSGGFFVFNHKMFDYLKDDCILEREPLENLVKDKQLSVYNHTGFWGSMDTYKDVERLNEIWEREKKWKIW